MPNMEKDSMGRKKKEDAVTLIEPDFSKKVKHIFFMCKEDGTSRLILKEKADENANICPKCNGRMEEKCNK